jgi:hypothetical protein
MHRCHVTPAETLVLVASQEMESFEKHEAVRG